MDSKSYETSSYEGDNARQQSSEDKDLHHSSVSEHEINDLTGMEVERSPSQAERKLQRSVEISKSKQIVDSYVSHQFNRQPISGLLKSAPMSGSKMVDVDGGDFAYYQAA